MVQIQELQDKVNCSLNDAREFLWSWNCLWIITLSQSTHEYSESQRNGPPRLLLAAWFTDFIRYLRKRFWKSTCSRLEKSKNLASSSCGLRAIETGKALEQGEEVRQEPQGSTIPTARNLTTWNPFILEELISELYDGKSEKSNLGTAFRYFPRLSGLSVLITFVFPVLSKGFQFLSFLLRMCTDAGIYHHCLSSGFFEEGAGIDHASVGEWNAALSFVLSLWTFSPLRFALLHNFLLWTLSFPNFCGAMCPWSIWRCNLIPIFRSSEE